MEAAGKSQNQTHHSLLLCPRDKTDTINEHTLNMGKYKTDTVLEHTLNMGKYKTDTVIEHTLNMGKYKTDTVTEHTLNMGKYVSSGNRHYDQTMKSNNDNKFQRNVRHISMRVTFETAETNIEQ